MALCDFHWTFLRLLSVCLFFSMSVQALDLENSINLQWPITKVAFNAYSDYVYVGGTNFLAMLTPNLDMVMVVDIGPVNDTDHCHPNPAPCNNTVTVLEFDMYSNGLIVCGTAYQGTCVRHDQYHQQRYVCLNAPKGKPTANRVSGLNPGGTIVHLFDVFVTTSAGRPPSLEIGSTPSPISCRCPDYGKPFFDISPPKIRPGKFLSLSEPSNDNTSGTGRLMQSPYVSGISADDATADVKESSSLTLVTRLLVASWDTSHQEEGSKDQPIVSLREISHQGKDLEMDFADGQESSAAGLHVKADLRDKVDYRFVDSVTVGNYTYLLSVRTYYNNCSSAGVQGKASCTKLTKTFLSRILTNETSLTPYTETELNCTVKVQGSLKAVEYDILMASTFGKMGSETLGYYVEITALIASFGRTTKSGSTIPDRDENTAICVFSLSALDQEGFDIVASFCKQFGCPAAEWIKKTPDAEMYYSWDSKETLRILTKSFSHKGLVKSLVPYTPLTGGQILSDRMNVYTADTNGYLYKFGLKAHYDTNYGRFDVNVLKQEFAKDVNEAIVSKEPSLSGVVDQKRAVAYLTYGTEILSVSLDVCRKFITCDMCRANVNRKCRWCSKINTCVESDFNSKLLCKGEDAVNYCPPQIDSFLPQEVPEAGGSVITIRGRNFGTEDDDGAVTVTVCGQTCDNVRPKVNVLECTVASRCARCNATCLLYVEVNQRKSKGNTTSGFLSYVVPRVTSITPTSGPLSGGVEVQVKGEHLHVGTARGLEVSGTKCAIISNRLGESSDLMCRMERANFTTSLCGPMALRIDNHVSIDNGTEYCFMLDPTITDVYPRATIIAGGLDVKVTGSHLDSATDLYMRLVINPQEIYYIQCRNVSAKRMVCPIPDMTVEGNYYRIVNATMSFQMDTGTELTLSTKSNSFSIHPNPRFPILIDKSSYIHHGLKDNIFSIQAVDIPEWLQPSEIHIYIGDAQCPVVSVVSSKININVTIVLVNYDKYLEGFKTTPSQPPTTTTTTTTTATTTTGKDNTSSTVHPNSTTEIAVTSENVTTTTTANVSVDATTTTAVTHIIYNDSDNSMGLRGVPQASNNPSDATGIKISNTHRRPKRRVQEAHEGGSDEIGNSFIQLDIRVEIGNFKRSMGKVKVGHRPTPPTNSTTDPGYVAKFPTYLIIVIPVAVGVLFVVVVVLVCIIVKARNKRGLVPHSPYYMEGNMYSYPGSSEMSVPSLVQILESELEPSKREQISSLIISLDRLVIGKEIGSGNFGRVYEGALAPKDKEAPVKIAIKTVQETVSYTVNLREFVKEAIIMVGFEHPHVLGLVGLAEREVGVPYVILPYMQNGDLLTYVRDSSRTLSLHDVIQFGADICSGMAYLSSVKLVHRDLAARNCMLDNGYRAKVADFGLCRDIYEKGYYTSDNKKKLPIRWMAIESIEHGAYTTKSDVWSMAIVLWELLTRGVVPYPGIDGWDITNFLRKRRPEPPRFCPDQLYKLMMTCWAKNPDMRPTFKALQRELLLMTGQDTGTEDNTLSDKQTEIGADPAVANDTQITAGTSKVEKLELRHTGKPPKYPTVKDQETGSSMSVPRAHVVENPIIQIPECYDVRNVSKAAADVYMQLVDNYEPAPKFHNPFHRSRNRKSKPDSRKTPVRGKSEHTSSLGNKPGVGASRESGESSTSHYHNPYEDDERDSRAISGDLNDNDMGVTIRVENASVNSSRKGFSNYFELERNSHRSSFNSILDDRSSVGSSVAGFQGSFRSIDTGTQSKGKNPQSSLAASVQNVGSTTGASRDVSDGGNVNQQTWQEPTVELRSNEDSHTYDRLSGRFMNSVGSHDYGTVSDCRGNKARNSSYLEPQTASKDIIPNNDEASPDYSDPQYIPTDSIPRRDSNDESSPDYLDPQYIPTDSIPRRDSNDESSPDYLDPQYIPTDSIPRRDSNDEGSPDYNDPQYIPTDSIPRRDSNDEGSPDYQDPQYIPTDSIPRRDSNDEGSPDYHDPQYIPTDSIPRRDSNNEGSPDYLDPQYIPTDSIPALDSCVGVHSRMNGMDMDPATAKSYQDSERQMDIQEGCQEELTTAL